MMTVQAAAERMGISSSLVYELCACGSLTHVRIGRPGSRGCIRITEADISEFLAKQKVEGTAPLRARHAKRKKVFKHIVIPN
jgi:excisionase family DNA binding protein